MDMFIACDIGNQFDVVLDIHHRDEHGDVVTDYSHELACRIAVLCIFGNVKNMAAYALSALCYPYREAPIVVIVCEELHHVVVGQEELCLAVI